MDKTNWKEIIYAVIVGCLGGIVTYFFLLMFYLSLGE